MHLNTKTHYRNLGELFYSNKIGTKKSGRKSTIPHYVIDPTVRTFWVSRCTLSACDQQVGRENRSVSRMWPNRESRSALDGIWVKRLLHAVPRYSWILSISPPQRGFKNCMKFSFQNTAQVLTKLGIWSSWEIHSYLDFFCTYAIEINWPLHRKWIECYLKDKLSVLIDF